jgi:hypothetical protein
MAADRVYRGDRTIDGALVSVDERPLDEHFEVKVFTDHGFEWSYEGEGPRQLAFAMLADHLGDAQKALALVEDFMTRVVANFDNEWEMTSADIDRALENIRPGLSPA